MTEAELRALIRDAVARHVAAGAGGAHLAPALGDAGSRGAHPAPIGPPAAVAVGDHASHALYVTIVNDSDACVIEPTVACHHCGYCKSHGF
jgi:hypothetical protein